MSKGGLIGFELRLDQLLELVRPKPRKTRKVRRPKIGGVRR